MSEFKIGDPIRVIADYQISGCYVYDKTGKIKSLEVQNGKTLFLVETEDFFDIRLLPEEMILLEADVSTIAKTILHVWEDMPEDVFNGIDFVRKVKEIMVTPNRYADTILNEMRRLKRENKLHYEVMDQQKSQYIKLKIRTKEELDIPLTAKKVKTSTNKLI